MTMNDVAVDKAFSSLGLPWTAKPDEILARAHALRLFGAPQTSPSVRAAKIAYDFAVNMAVAEDVLLEQHAGPFRWHHGVLLTREAYLALEGLPSDDEDDALEAEGLLQDAPVVAPPEAWEATPTRVWPPRSPSPKYGLTPAEMRYALGALVAFIAPGLILLSL